MKLEVRYRTLLGYSELAAESHNELRACPASTPQQRLVDYQLTVQPRADVFAYRDAWGTRVDAFGIRLPHIAVEIVADSVVETSAPVPVDGSAGTEVLDASSVAEAYAEYLRPTRHTAWASGIEALAASARSIGDGTVGGLARAVHELVHQDLAYERGVTQIGTTAEQVMAGGGGVCQDFAHLAVATCRAAGLPARYVSGYFFTTDDADGAAPSGDVATVETHAWFEAAVPGDGWLAFDPTNGQAVGERHVKIGHGREYDDVLPFRGVFLGPATSGVEVDVEIQQAAPDAMPSTGRVFVTESEASLRLDQAQASAQQ